MRFRQAPVTPPERELVGAIVVQTLERGKPIDLSGGHAWQLLRNRTCLILNHAVPEI